MKNFPLHPSVKKLLGFLDDRKFVRVFQNSDVLEFSQIYSITTVEEILQDLIDSPAAYIFCSPEFIHPKGKFIQDAEITILPKTTKVMRVSNVP
jgi:hypothetical protein